MENIKVIGCGLVALAGLSTSFFRAAPVVQAVGVAAVLAPLAAVRRPVLSQAARFQALPAHGPRYTVTATAYSAVPGQTDDEPFVTADNSTIPADYTSQLRWLALSHDLLARWGGPFAYGDTVRVSGLSPALDGVYLVHDTMNRRHRHCLDVLAHPRERYDVFQPGVHLQLVSL